MRHFTYALLAVSVLLASCAHSPTGRRQLMLFDESKLSAMGSQTFEGMKKETPVSSNKKINQYVQCVANTLIKQTDAKWQQSPWEVVVFEDDQVNAFALPGGKIGVYTGLLLVAENQHQLAAVIGHEIAHVMAGHSNERLSSDQFIQTALTVADSALAATGSQYQQQLMTAFGVGAQIGVALPFSRTHESEADIIGLDLMAKAGFEPAQSVKLWQNMAAKGSGGTPQFLSSHPVPENRIKALDAHMAVAEGYFQQRRSQGALPACSKG
ncbi:M48 family metallopeptidase [Rheinheimera marina]|uniref:M48 family metallopeptidase n=1 Tax=Rheinheimera marina TaxID=1774958 RepID=A0ABV9JLI5_9GAMM